MPSTDQKITVMIAAYNASATIARAVASALAEPEVAEVIVVNDESTDDTTARAEAANDGSGRLKILRQIENAGPSAARNRAIRESTAPWIAVLDADDFFLPGRMQGLLQYAKDADFVADNMWQAAEGALDERTGLLFNQEAKPQKISFAEFVLSNVSDRNRPRGELGFVKPLMRRSFLDAHNIRYQEHMRLGEDYELYARALARGARFYLAPVQDYVSVTRSNSLSGQHTETDLLYLRDCDRTLQALPNLTPADRAALHRHYLSVDCRLQWRLLISAVKRRNLSAALATFFHPYPVPFYLAGQLAEQLVLRTARKLKGEAA